MLHLKKKYYTIGEVVEIINLPPYVIRFWEKNFSFVKPQKARGRRYYRRGDIEQLLLIKKLLYTDKLSIQAAKNILYIKAAGKASEYRKEAQIDQDVYDKGFIDGEFGLAINSLLEKFYNIHSRLNKILNK